MTVKLLRTLTSKTVQMINGNDAHSSQKNNKTRYKKNP